MSLCPVCNLPDCTWTAEGVCEGTMEPETVRRRSEDRKHRRKIARFVCHASGGLFTLAWLAHWMWGG